MMRVDVREEIIDNFKRGFVTNSGEAVQLNTELCDRQRILSLLEALNLATIQASMDFFFLGDILDCLYQELKLKIDPKVDKELSVLRARQFPYMRDFQAHRCDEHYLKAKSLLESISIILRKEAHRQINTGDKK